MDTGIFAFASNSNPRTFTPIKRRESTINTRQFNADSEKDWTTARCHRLLRALTSRVAILKKEISRFAQPGKDVAATRAGGAQVGSKANDSDWTQARKRIRRTYSSRGGKAGNVSQAGDRASKGSKMKKSRRSFAPGEILVSTPLLARAKGDRAEEIATTLSVPIADELPVVKTKRRRTRYTMGIPEGDFQLTKPLREIRQDITTVRYTTYEGIYNGLEALLRATEQDEPETKRKGARSLSSMALRAVPRYVTEQETLLEAHMQETGSKSAIQSRDIATEIYDELESFGTSGHGWPQLRAVVRSHGIEVLGDAIRRGLLDIDFCGSLISLCIHTSAIDEGQLLLAASVSAAQYSIPRALYDPLSRPVAMLCKFAHHTGQSSFQYRQLAYIISSATLPVEWLASKDFGSIWTEVIQAPSLDSDNGDALAFLETSMSALAHYGLRTKATVVMNAGMAEAVGNTFSSLLTTFLSIILLSKETEHQVQPDTLDISQRHNHFATLLRNSLFGYQLANPSITSKSILPLLANLFIDHGETDLWGPESHMAGVLLAYLEQSGDDFSSISSAYSESVTFVCQIARCCGRGASTSGFEYLEHLHLILEGLLCGRPGSNILMGLIVDSAFTFAQKVPDRKHLDYAANMDAKYFSRGFDTEASLHNISVNDNDNVSSGFRWEEGIGEWVTATPAADHAKRKCAIEEASEESECDTPYRPPPNLRRKVDRDPTPPAVASSPQGSSQEEDDTHSETLQSPQVRAQMSVIEISPGSEQSANESSLTSGSEDELADNSLQSMDSSMMEESVMEESDDEIELSFTEDSLGSFESPSLLKTTLTSNHRTSIYRAPRLNRKIFHKSDDFQVFDESFASTASSVSSDESGDSAGPRREYIDRAPRLGRKALQTSDTWQLFDESDDELSLLSVSSPGDQALQDVTRTSFSNVLQRPRQAKPSLTQSKSKTMSKRITAHLSDSEDELCI
ncbi:uncharacterized protein LY89DRAFT_422290 [Mollisia scopiformis]|uniref:Uncharacterized protein n=1 Tax=Mollisia scopiformis TaxID=149040 RepID=A0A194XMJ7_MOLSC|nr:uncharacterized protein LY89DRAFT_422290 [Mollisia scopiformis]KUJ20997.1 hypothetical protein LY89DRAFT_422290 [Mollisia scopiformis]